ncbi:GGDEF domain-containing protein [Chloroflexus sp.]|uniref:GGDEF domain-containing protein n=1 Tax=Chloroflexus sp. TaxID=1904827 RepID=UPI002619A7A6|nr:GGDEF domain-containing protein [uncultured Chloroflexus sp.]
MQTMIEQERNRFDQQRRRTYQIAGSLGILLVAFDIINLIFDQVQPLWVRLIYIGNDLALIGVSLAVIWMVTFRRGRLVTVERFTFIVFSAESLLFNGIVPPILGQTLTQLQQQTINDDIWFLLMICTLGFHLFRHRTGLIIVAGLYGVSIAIVAGQITLAGIRGIDIGPGLQALQIYGMGALFLCLIYIVSRYRSQSQRLQIEYELVETWAFIDMLTGVANRRRGEQVLVEAIAHSRRYNEPLTICLWDLDYFKRINDTYGHAEGDQVLRRVAQLAQATIRETDTIARWGGEEFCLLLPRTRQTEAEALINRLRREIMAKITLRNQPVTASFGIAEYRATDDLQSLLARADEALYVAKVSGRNRVWVAA